jgi:hypothetical protein
LRSPPAPFASGFDGFELFALNHVEVAKNTLSLTADDRLDFLADAIRRTRRVGEELSKLIEKPS